MGGYESEEWLTDFDGREYGVGVVRGTRSFGVDPTDGTLTGVYYCTPWQPGENNALCFAFGSLDNYPYNSIAATSYMAGGTSTPLGEMSWPKKHSMNNCSCGYYAYYNGSNDYYSAFSAPVSGIVEGYGETVIGTKGFRTRKARIVALCIPGRIPDAKSRRTWRKFSTWKRLTHWVVAIISLSLMVACLVSAAVFSHAPVTPLSFLPFFTGPLAFLGTTAFLRAITPSRYRHPAELSDKDIAKVRAKYLNIPIYNSFEDMIAAFPPDHEALKQVERKK